MRISRWLELGSGLASGIVGLAIIAFVLFGPIYQGTMSSACTVYASGQQTDCTGAGTVTTTATFAQVNGGYPTLALYYFSALSAVLLAVIVSTLLHWHSRRRAWRWRLWAAVALLFITALAGFDLWVFMLPSLLLGLVAALAASGNRPVAAG